MNSVLTDDQARINIAANVRRLLRDRGWSQNELARRANEPAMNISRIVRGSNLPGIGLLSRIAEAFDVSIDRLVAPLPEDSAKISA